MAITGKPSKQRSLSHLHPDRAKRLGIKPAKPPKPKSEHSQQPHFTTTTAADTTATAPSSLKRKIRDITRLLHAPESSQRSLLPDGVRIEKERALAAYTQTVEEAEAVRQRQRMIKKYHMVRFFERQRATRRLRRLEKLVTRGGDGGGGDGDEGKAKAGDGRGGEEEVEGLRKEIENVKIDLDYTIYCPLNEKYVSLYPRGKEHGDTRYDGVDGGDAQHTQEKPAMWDVVRKCRREGTLEDLREGKITGEKSAAVERGRGDAARGEKRRRRLRDVQSKRRKTDGKREGEDDSSESGFFSE